MLEIFSSVMFKMECIDTVLNMLGEEISRGISEGISNSGKPGVHLASSKVPEIAKAETAQPALNPERSWSGKTSG